MHTRDPYKTTTSTVCPNPNPCALVDMIITDQPLRLFAVIVCAPLLLWRGCIHNDSWVIAYATSLFVVDLFCIMFLRPDKIQETVACTRGV